LRRRKNENGTEEERRKIDRETERERQGKILGESGRDRR
jgi:hypothetical protein